MESGIMPHDHAPQAVNALVNKDLFDTGYDWDSLREKVKRWNEKWLPNGSCSTSSISILVGTTQAIEPVYKKKMVWRKLIRINSCCCSKTISRNLELLYTCFWNWPITSYKSSCD